MQQASCATSRASNHDDGSTMSMTVRRPTDHYGAAPEDWGLMAAVSASPSPSPSPVPSSSPSPSSSPVPSSSPSSSPSPSPIPSPSSSPSPSPSSSPSASSSPSPSPSPSPSTSQSPSPSASPSPSPSPHPPQIHFGCDEFRAIENADPTQLCNMSVTVQNYHTMRSVTIELIGGNAGHQLVLLPDANIPPSLIVDIGTSSRSVDISAADAPQANVSDFSAAMKAIGFRTDQQNPRSYTTVRAWGVGNTFRMEPSSVLLFVENVNDPPVLYTGLYVPPSLADELRPEGRRPGLPKRASAVCMLTGDFSLRSAFGGNPLSEHAEPGCRVFQMHEPNIYDVDSAAMGKARAWFADYVAGDELYNGGRAGGSGVSWRPFDHEAGEQWITSTASAGAYQSALGSLFLRISPVEEWRRSVLAESTEQIIKPGQRKSRADILEQAVPEMRRVVFVEVFDAEGAVSNRIEVAVDMVLQLGSPVPADVVGNDGDEEQPTDAGTPGPMEQYESEEDMPVEGSTPGNADVGNRVVQPILDVDDEGRVYLLVDLEILELRRTQRYRWRERTLSGIHLFCARASIASQLLPVPWEMPNDCT
eukprot:TRINITY_DN2702_c2_g1_i1.p1 TRINITY_DN2702_c2_g1~~TRINITY_DN2702_c2_g1_i1.p1  ORF type:complete len:589 (-),score=130.54 TRINITY_DN2702_c2_g1_i1:722-2488(-)